MTYEQMLQRALQAFGSGDLAEAERLCRTVLSQQPNEPLALHVLAMVGMQVGQVEPALELFAQSVSLQPGNPDFHANFAHALNRVSRHTEAAEQCQQALRLQPGHSQAHKVLGGALVPQGRLIEAIDSFQRAIQCNANDAECHAGLAIVLSECGRMDESVSAYRKALALNPGSALVHSNLLFQMFYLPDITSQAIAMEHRNWNTAHAAVFEKRSRNPFDNLPEPNRRLKIGYVSSDFHDHPVGRFILPILESHDRAKFEVFAYSNSIAADDRVTTRIRSAVENWCSIPWVSDDAVEARIRLDQIDVLVDLSGHSARGRLLLFARKPAPVQVTYLGYPGTTGLSAIDYRLTDSYSEPPGKTEELHSERLSRLEECFLCYRPSDDCPPVADGPPALRSGDDVVTFGCFNTLKKINPPLVEDWCAILHRVPRSRLLLKCQGFSDPLVCQQVLTWFERHSIASDRVELRAWDKTFSQHFSAYNQIDIALDTYPYSGTTTTCDALWMGVPVVTRAGDAHVSRVSASLLNSLKLTELIGESREHYIQIAAAMAGDLTRLLELRRSLRARMQESPLMDAESLTREIERAFRKMWQSWCKTALG